MEDLFTMFTKFLVVPSLRGEYAKLTLLYKILFLIMHLFDKYLPWYKMPVVIGLFYLEIRRTVLYKHNLIPVGQTKSKLTFNPKEYPFRTANGMFNDPKNAETGSEDSFFGRNNEPQPQREKIMDPHPTVVATKLLARREFIGTAKQFNLLATAWINFMIHDWVDHMEDTKQVEITAPESVASKCPLKSFRFYASKEFPVGRGQIGYKNIRTPWWDASNIYGNDAAELKRVRTMKDGKLFIAHDGWLYHNAEGINVSGDIRNEWAGIALLQAIFIKEHNAVCDEMRRYHPEFTDEDLYHRARLVTSAVIAKIHTIDWTPQLLKTDMMLAALRTNWYGLLGKRIKDTFGKTSSSILSGLVGSKPDDYGVPYSLTEDFVSVYRLHPLLPEQVDVRDIKATPVEKYTPAVVDEVPMPELLAHKGDVNAQKLGVETLLASLGHQASGALTLFNYPLWMRKLVAENVDGTPRADLVDMPSLEMYRDRERSVPRYNQFRRSLLMLPIARWEDLTDDKEAIAAIRELYGNNVENLDLLVGLMAEKKIKGFAISETSFFIFLIMASRRLGADRFFTTDFNEQVYSKEGLKWVNTTEGLKDVLQRHYPQLVHKWMSATSAFSVWNQTPDPYNPIPIYLRWSS
ncbi:unnamed protein product [Sphagnum compactum]